MRLWERLWADEAGIILSAEAVVVGTVAVVGLTAGMSVVAKAVNEELRDVSLAIRSLDQSYSIPGLQGCGAKTAGSSFTQAPVKQSLEKLHHEYDKLQKQEKAQSERLQQQLKQQKLKEQQLKERENRRDQPEGAGRKGSRREQPRERQQKI